MKPRKPLTSKHVLVGKKSTKTILVISITILIVTMIQQIPHVTFSLSQDSSTLRTQVTPSESPYLVNEQDKKILRVPYLHQDYVGHCWLYAAGMIVTYYGARFSPDDVLNLTSKGFNAGLSPSEMNKFSQTLSKLYGITLNHAGSKGQLKLEVLENLIISEINKAKPIYLVVFGTDTRGEKGAHAVVVTGYIKNKNGLYVTINDPSGWLTHGVLGSNYRFDGSFVNTFEVYHVLVKLEDLYNKLTEIDVYTVNTNLTPNPPKVIVYAYTISPQISNLILYNMTERTYNSRDTRFYHNNYMDRSLWYEIPIASLGSVLNIWLFVYPNTMIQHSFVTIVTVIANDLHIGRQTYEYEFEVSVSNISTRSIKCTRNCHHVSPTNQIIFPLIHTGNITVLVETFDKDTNKREYVWGPIDVYVYENVISSYWTDPDSSSSLVVFAGVNKRYDGKKIVDLYLSYRVPIPRFPSSFTSRHEIEIYYPSCNGPIKLIGESPSEKGGGYYKTCSLILNETTKMLTIKGKLKSFFLIWIPSSERSFEIVINLEPSESSIINVHSIEVHGRNNLLYTNVSYCSIDSSLTKVSELNISLSVLGTTASFQAKKGTCEDLSLIIPIAPTTPIFVINATLVSLTSNGKTNIEYRTLKAVVNPLFASVSGVLEVKGIASPGSWVDVVYDVELRSIPSHVAKYIIIDSVVQLNDTLVDSVTYVKNIGYEVTEDKYVYRLVTSFRIPYTRDMSFNDSTIYSLKIYPKFKYNDVVSSSPDLYVQGHINVRRTEPGVDRVAYVLVIDVSGSMNDVFRDRTKLDWAKEASVFLLNLTHDGDYVGVVVFSSYPRILQEVVILNPQNRVDIIEKIHGLYASGSTNIGDSLKLATDMLLNSGLTEIYRPVIILLTDGMHNTGTHPIDILDYVRNSGVRVYTIGLGEPRDIDEDVLKTVADATGGAYYYAPTPDMLKELFLTIRGIGLIVNLVDSITFVATPLSQVNYTYVLDLSQSNYTLEIFWSHGNEPDIVLLVANEFTVTKDNATLFGIVFEYHTSNSIRVTIPQFFTILQPSFPSGFSYEVEITISIINKNPYDTIFRIDVIGGAEELLYINLDNPFGRYRRGQPIHFRVLAEKNSLVEVTVENETGAVQYAELVFISDSHLAVSSMFSRVINVPLEPGAYVLKARLYRNGLLKKTSIVPVYILDEDYEQPLKITPELTIVNGYGVFEVPLYIQVLKDEIMNNIVYITPKLETSTLDPRLPEVYVDPWILIMSKSVERTTLRLNVPVNTQPGFYNLTLIAYVDGHSVIEFKNVVTIVVPSITVDLEVSRGVVIAQVGETLNIDGFLRVSGDQKISTVIMLKPVFTDDVVQINNASEFSTTLITNYTMPLNISIVAKEIGIYRGNIKVYVSDTHVLSIPMTIVSVPREAEVNRTIWGVGFNYLRIGPTTNVKAGIEIFESPISMGFIAAAAKPRSSHDYIVFVDRYPNSPTPIVKIYLEEEGTTPVVVVVEELGGRVTKYSVPPINRTLVVELGDKKLYRVWIEKPSWESPARPVCVTEVSTETMTVTYTETIESHISTRISDVMIISLFLLLIASITLNILLYKRIRSM